MKHILQVTQSFREVCLESKHEAYLRDWKEENKKLNDFFSGVLEFVQI